jgi:hypothetical protein
MASCALALGVGACSSSSPAKTDGSAGTGGGGIVLTPSATGFLDGTNAAMVLGAWYAYGDNYSSTGIAGMGDCEVKGMHAAATCSTFDASVAQPGQPFVPMGEDSMCTKGTAAMVVNDSSGMADYSNMFGAGIGLDLNNAGADGGTGKQPYNATMHGITGISFDIDMVPGNNLRVEFPTSLSPGVTDINGAYWKGSMMGSPVKAGMTNVIHWGDVEKPFYLTSNLNPYFDPTKILSIQFHVYTNATAAVPFQFCVSHLTMLMN